MDYIPYFIMAALLYELLRRVIPMKGVKQITTDQLQADLKHNNKQFIDVRTPGEYQHAHVPGFKNIPLHQLKQQLNHLYQDQEVIIICRSGSRSMRAARILKKNGYKHVTNVKGGMNTWQGPLK
ncbi:MAG TPA: rhodanese-like domain-containing protein [Bacillota bacterium]|nr:rhodanese-like domain-containing protein [Bacillota bacterium]